MTFGLMDSGDGFLHIGISGVMTLADQAAVQNEAGALIARGIKPRVLVVLDRFGGWEKNPGWNDVTFLAEHGDDIARMAIVGDERWRDEVLMFVASGMRTTEIEYFTPDRLEQARRWARE